MGDVTTSSPISHVSDTARWVALYRAMESERPDALFRDPYARRLAGELGEEIVRALPNGRTWAWPMIVRTAVMDELILHAVTHDEVDAVVNLAAGLDARPYRLPLPPALHWIEADFPDVIAYKEAQLGSERPVCALERVGVDLSDAAQRRAFLSNVRARHAGLVITEGLLIYLTAEIVAAIADDLHANRAFHYWLMDLGGRRLLKMLARTWGNALARGNAPFRFAPAEGTGFFAPHGWREAEYRSIWDESIRLDRSVRFARFWQLVGRLAPRAKREEWRRTSGVVLLERG